MLEICLKNNKYYFYVNKKLFMTQGIYKIKKDNRLATEKESKQYFLLYALKILARFGLINKN
jgi:hypothetical protein